MHAAASFLHLYNPCAFKDILTASHFTVSIQPLSRQHPRSWRAQGFGTDKYIEAPISLDFWIDCKIHCQFDHRRQRKCLQDATGTKRRKLHLAKLLNVALDTRAYPYPAPSSAIDAIRNEEANTSPDHRASNVMSLCPTVYNQRIQAQILREWILATHGQSLEQCSVSS